MGKRELRIKPQSENNTNTRKERDVLYERKNDVRNDNQQHFESPA